MSSKQLGKKPAPTPNTGTATGASTTKSGKSKEQLEFLTSHHLGFLTHQTATTLNRFWPPVFDGWYKKWPITVTPADIKQYGSPANAILVFRKVTNELTALTSGITASRISSRPVGRSTGSLSQPWEGIAQPLRPSGSSIPIDFKLKIAKEFYDALPPAEKKKSMTVATRNGGNCIGRFGSSRTSRARQKLAWHEVSSNRRCVFSKVGLRPIPKITPANMFPMELSQGGGEELDFRAFCGSDWDNVIEKRFMEWGMQIFGEPGTSGRKTFMFTNAPPVPDPGASSSAVSDSGFDVTEASDVLPLPQDLISFPVAGELHTTVPRASNFVSPQEIFGPGARNLRKSQVRWVHHGKKTAIVPSAATQPLLPAPSSDLVLAHSSALLPTPSSDLVPAPVLDSCQADVDRVVLEPTPVTALPISHMTPEIPPTSVPVTWRWLGTAAAATSTYKLEANPMSAGDHFDADRVGYELLKQPDVPSFATSSPPTSSSPTPSTTSFGEIPLDGPSIATERSTLLASRITPSYRIDRSDIPSWLIERGRLDSVLMVEAGSLWERLIALWLRQERRLGFGLDEKIGTNLPMTNKPQILKEYFKWRHDPSKGDAVTYQSLARRLRSGGQLFNPSGDTGARPPPTIAMITPTRLPVERRASSSLSYAWLGGITVSLPRRTTPPWISATYLPTMRWSNIVNDLIFVLELAQGWTSSHQGYSETPVVTSGQPETKRVASWAKEESG
ncbi:hypothetical protein BJ322DRAFT_1023687 [Thelephora terrestris]|uniref:Uncharacterized protein n=1 Tax=Thelephora terrestris TaxID=56493 RepID=A0A9P6H7Y8_9AGAM|nr:hypothetical protein BJ322DRAFT_1023687 [Thelephora terrestris]